MTKYFIEYLEYSKENQALNNRWLARGVKGVTGVQAGHHNLLKAEILSLLFGRCCPDESLGGCEIYPNGRVNVFLRRRNVVVGAFLVSDSLDTLPFPW